MVVKYYVRTSGRVHKQEINEEVEKTKTLRTEVCVYICGNHTDKSCVHKNIN